MTVKKPPKKKTSKKNGKSKLRVIKGSKKKSKKKPNQQSGKSGLPSLSPREEIPHLCKHAGRCCWSGGANQKGYGISGTGLIPFDIWRMITSPLLPLAQFGIQTTGQLLDESRGITFFGLTPDMKMPACGLRMVPYRNMEGATRHCPFLVWEHKSVSDIEEKQLQGGELPGPSFWLVDGEPRFSCGLGGSKPVQCDSFPVGRYLSRMDKGKIRLHVVCSTDICEECMPKTVGKNKGPTANDYVRQPDVQQYMQFTAQYMAVLDLIQKQQTPDEVRLAMARTMFDFDSLILKGLTTPDPEVAADMLVKGRPKDPVHLVQAAIAVMDAFNKQAQKIHAG